MSLIRTLPSAPDLKPRLIDAVEGFKHTVRIYDYGVECGLEILVEFGGQGVVGDLRSAREARELAFALLAAADDLEQLNAAGTYASQECA